MAARESWGRGGLPSAVPLATPDPAELESAPAISVCRGLIEIGRTGFPIKGNAHFCEGYSPGEHPGDWSISVRVGKMLPRASWKNMYLVRKKCVYQRSNAFPSGEADLCLLADISSNKKQCVTLPNRRPPLQIKDLLASLLPPRIGFLCIVSYFIMNNVSCHLGGL